VGPVQLVERVAAAAPRQGQAPVDVGDALPVELRRPRRRQAQPRLQPPRAGAPVDVGDDRAAAQPRPVEGLHRQMADVDAEQVQRRPPRLQLPRRLDDVAGAQPPREPPPPPPVRDAVVDRRRVQPPAAAADARGG